jgi:pimeloyl-ACP methyl ester carboxylesterase
MLLLLKIAFALCAIPATGALYQYVSTQYENYQYPPVGKMIDVGGYKLHINDMGTSGPTVILDAGIGCNSLDWALVQPEIAKFTRVCSIDRAGSAWSESSSRPRTSEVIVEEMHSLLKNGNIPSPYILVGHSFGGLNCQLYANKYPDEVAGIVLVDSAHEDQVQRLPQDSNNAQEALLKQKTLLLILSRLGVVRLLHKLPQAKKQVEVFPENIRTLYFSQKLQTKHLKTVLEETDNLRESLNQLKQAENKLKNKPLIVISAGKAPTPQEVGLSKEVTEKFTAAWDELQKDLASKSTKSRHIIAQNSNHMIPQHQPKVIIDAVRDMMHEINDERI